MKNTIDKLMELLAEFNINSTCKSGDCDKCLLNSHIISTHDCVEMDFCDMLIMMKDYFKK